MITVEEDESVFDSHFPLIEKSDDDVYDEATLLDIKQNLNEYSFKKTEKTS